MNKERLVILVKQALEEHKAIDVIEFYVSTITSIADMMIIASGRSNRQVSAIAERIVQTVKQHEGDIIGVEGMRDGEWVLVDLGDIIVHIMHPRSREYYQLEKLWGDNDMHIRGQ